MKLRSYQFRREREKSWQELEALVAAGEKKGLNNLSASDLFRLPVLYRSVLSSLSVSRAISLETNVVSYLENLSSRTYFLLYGVRGKTGAMVWRFFTEGFPSSVRNALPLVLFSLFAMLLGVAAGYFLTAANPDWFYAFVSEGYSSGRGPTASTEELRNSLFAPAEETGASMLTVFSTFLFTHNARIGMLAFALGFAFGLPTLFLLFLNGATLGAFIAVFESRGLGPDFLGWVMVHGSTELLAVVLCGGAGLVLARAIILPERKSRRQSLAERGQSAAVIVVGAVLLFLIAGLLEGYARQLVQDTGTRLVIGGGFLALWIVYFAVPWHRLGGRRQ